MNTQELIARKKVIVIVRRLYGDELVRLARAMYDGGLRLMELTFDQSDPDCLKKTPESIRALRRELPEDMLFGAGTVLTAAQVEAAADAGSLFIISPNTDEKVIRRTRELGLASIPGAMTPSEIMTAHELGADFVKVFPANLLGGPAYAKAVLAPLSHIRLIATSGVNLENFEGYLQAGMAGAGLSGVLSDKKLIAQGDWAEFTRRAKAFNDIAERY